jgi:allantoicase
MMAQSRPFADRKSILEAADRIWASLDTTDWLEAFASHPEIGSGASGLPTVARVEPPSRAKMSGSGELGGSRRPALSEPRIATVEGSEWSDEEQAGARAAASSVQQRLVTANREYEQRFGYIFIVCATGKTGDEMLAMLERRLQHAPDEELAIAAEEQRKITRLRLAKLLAGARAATS